MTTKLVIKGQGENVHSHLERFLGFPIGGYGIVFSWLPLVVVGYQNYCAALRNGWGCNPNWISGSQLNKEGCTVTISGQAGAERTIEIVDERGLYKTRQQTLLEAVQDSSNVTITEAEGLIRKDAEKNGQVVSEVSETNRLLREQNELLKKQLGIVPPETEEQKLKQEHGEMKVRLEELERQRTVATQPTPKVTTPPAPAPKQRGETMAQELERLRKENANYRIAEDLRKEEEVKKLHAEQTAAAQTQQATS